MKILYLSEMLGPHDYRFLSMDIARGYNVTLLTHRKDLDAAGMESRHYDVRNIKGLKIVHSPGLADNTAVNIFRRIMEIKRIIRAEKPDVLHAGWILTSGLVAALSGFHPYLLMPWGSDIMYYAKSSVRNRIIAGYAISRADMITCDCEYEKRILADDFKYPEGKVVVMPWDVDLQVFRKSNNDPALKEKLGFTGRKVLLMMRIFRPAYGIEDFIKALPAVKEANPEARVLMLGYGPIENDLKDLASDLALDGFIHWTGYVPQREVVKYINASDIYVSTSLMDGSSSSLLEAMACGLPAVVTDIPGNMEWVKDGVNGIVVKKSDPVSISKGINRLLKDDDLRVRMSGNNIKKIESDADFSKNFSRLENTYRLLAGAGGKAQ